MSDDRHGVAAVPSLHGGRGAGPAGGAVGPGLLDPLPGLLQPPQLAGGRRGPRSPGRCWPDRVLAAAVASDIEGLTLLGGEPFDQAGPLAALAEAVRAGGQSVMTFTGHVLEDLRAAGREDWDRLLAATDLLVDGPYLAERPGAAPAVDRFRQPAVLVPHRPLRQPGRAASKPFRTAWRSGSLPIRRRRRQRLRLRGALEELLADDLKAVHATPCAAPMSIGGAGPAGRPTRGWALNLAVPLLAAGLAFAAIVHAQEGPERHEVGPRPGLQHRPRPMRRSGWKEPWLWARPATCSSAEARAGCVIRVDTAGVGHLAIGGGQRSATCPACGVRLSRPVAVAVGPDGTVYVLDQAELPRPVAVAARRHRGRHRPRWPPGDRIAYRRAIAMDTAGRLYVAESGRGVPVRPVWAGASWPAAGERDVGTGRAGHQRAGSTGYGHGGWTGRGSLPGRGDEEPGAAARPRRDDLACSPALASMATTATVGRPPRRTSCRTASPPTTPATSTSRPSSPTGSAAWIRPARSRRFAGRGRTGLSAEGRATAARRRRAALSIPDRPRLRRRQPVHPRHVCGDPTHPQGRPVRDHQHRRRGPLRVVPKNRATPWRRGESPRGRCSVAHPAPVPVGNAPARRGPPRIGGAARVRSARFPDAARRPGTGSVLLATLLLVVVALRDRGLPQLRVIPNAPARLMAARAANQAPFVPPVRGSVPPPPRSRWPGSG